MRLTLSALLLAAYPVMAQDIYDSMPLTCQGDDPEWTLSVSEDGVLFDYVSVSELEIAWVTVGEGAERPVALTLIGRGDTAIVVLEPTKDDATSDVRILTQRGETPVLLIGECEPP